MIQSLVYQLTDMHDQSYERNEIMENENFLFFFYLNECKDMMF